MQPVHTASGWHLGGIIGAGTLLFSFGIGLLLVKRLV
jgi:uncharacterized membrane protein YczE